MSSIIINGKAYDVIIPDGTVKVIDGTSFPILGITELSAEAIPIAYCKFYDGTSILTLPIYDPIDITNNQLRIYTGSATGCFDLVALSDSASSGIRVYTGSDTLCIKQV